MSVSENPKRALKRLLIARAAIQLTCWPMILVTSVLKGSIASRGGVNGLQWMCLNIPAKRGSAADRCEMA